MIAFLKNELTLRQQRR